MSRLEVLVATMHQKDHSLLERMNIQSDAVVINQCDENSYEEFSYKGFTIKWVSVIQRGVGRSRNMAIAYASADILLFADDDVAYGDGYAQLVTSFFEENRRVCLATFNFTSQNPHRPEPLDAKDHKIHTFNSLRYGAFRIAVRREAVLAAGICYSLLFGGGAPHQAGEDNLFINDCLRKGLRARACSRLLGTVKQEQSTWFQGYNEKYYTDRGALFRAMYGRAARPMLLLFELKNIRRKSDFSLLQRYRLSSGGMKKFDGYKG